MQAIEPLTLASLTPDRRPLTQSRTIKVLRPRGGHLGSRRFDGFYVWQDRVRDPSLTILLVLQLLLLFVALPLDAAGVPIAEPVVWSLLLVVLTIIVVLSRRGVAIALMLVGLAAATASSAGGGRWSPIIACVLYHGGFVIAFVALNWVVARALYAPVVSRPSVFKARQSFI
jgi:hypothetical protein